MQSDSHVHVLFVGAQVCLALRLPGLIALHVSPELSHLGLGSKAGLTQHTVMPAHGLQVLGPHLGRPEAGLGEGGPQL